MRVIVFMLLQFSALAALADDALWQALRSQPNLIVLLRHAPAGGGDGAVYDASGKCRGERMLTTAGQSLASKMGAQFASHKIRPRVISSPLCRARDTAQLAFRRFKLESALREIASANVNGIQDFEIAAKRLALSYRGSRPLVMVTHQPNIEALTFESIESGEAVVARVSDAGEIEVLGRMRIVPPA